MRTERNGKYLHSFDSEHFPDIGWEEMLDSGILIPPETLKLVLKDAKDYLCEEEGPNLERRIKLATDWFNWWQKHLSQDPASFRKREFPLNYKLCPFGELSRRLEDPKLKHLSSGILNVAGAEGHAGHRFSAKQLASKVSIAVYAFEQDSYFLKKERPAPFLRLPLRLSMWVYSPLTFVTVNPEAQPGVDLNTHYQNLFNKSGVERSFADELDPNFEVKIKRGKPGPRGYDDNLLTHLTTPSTSERVERLLPEVEE